MPENEPESREPFELLRKVLPFTALAVLIAALYVGWTFYSRANDARRAEQQVKDKQIADAQHTVDVLGGRNLKILMFYAMPGAIRRGGHANVCFGVNEAKSVRLDPPVEELHPAMSHCFQVSPAKTTEYKLTAEDGKGHSVSQSFELQVIR